MLTSFGAETRSTVDQAAAYSVVHMSSGGDKNWKFQGASCSLCDFLLDKLA